MLQVVGDRCVAIRVFTKSFSASVSSAPWSMGWDWKRAYVLHNCPLVLCNSSGLTDPGPYPFPPQIEKLLNEKHTYHYSCITPRFIDVICVMPQVIDTTTLTFIKISCGFQHNDASGMS